MFLLGVSDDGNPTGLTVTDKLLLDIADMRSNGRILPLPSMTVEKRQLHGVAVVLIAVAPADSPPVRYKGRVHIRVGPRRDLASRQDERILNDRRIASDKPFDLMPTRARLEDLDTRYFAEVYLRRAVAADVLARNNRTEEEQLRATAMIDGSATPASTVQGVLVLGREPVQFIGGAYTQFLRIGGTALSDPILDAAHYTGKIEVVHDRIMEKLQAHIMVAVEIPTGARERRHESVPAAALQQLVANALMHRNYDGTNAPTKVTWFNDRVEIMSPGGPYGDVTVENFGQPGNADYRNPNLAAAMRNLGLAQGFGVGIVMARAALAAAGCPPIEWDVDRHWVRAIVRIAQ